MQLKESQHRLHVRNDTVSTFCIPFKDLPEHMKFTSGLFVVPDFTVTTSQHLLVPSNTLSQLSSDPENCWNFMNTCCKPIRVLSWKLKAKIALIYCSWSYLLAAAQIVPSWSFSLAIEHTFDHNNLGAVVGAKKNPANLICGCHICFWIVAF